MNATAGVGSFLAKIGSTEIDPSVYEEHSPQTVGILVQFTS